MKKSKQVKPTTDQENIYKYARWQCPGNPENDRKNRTPLGDIAALANNKQYLAVHPGEKENIVRSKSSSLAQVLSPNKPSSVQAESTRIPKLKQPLKKLPATVTVRTLQKSEAQKSLQKIPLRAGSSSCRCPANQNDISSGISSKDSDRTFNKEDIVDLLGDSNDDVFLQPISTKTRTQPKNSQTSSDPPKIVLTPTQQPLMAQSNKYFHHNQPQVQIPQKTDSSGPGRKGSIGTLKIHKARSAENLCQGQSSTKSSSNQNCVKSSSRLLLSSTPGSSEPKTTKTTQENEPKLVLNVGQQFLDSQKAKYFYNNQIQISQKTDHSDKNKKMSNVTSKIHKARSAENLNHERGLKESLSNQNYAKSSSRLPTPSAQPKNKSSLPKTTQTAQDNEYPITYSSSSTKFISEMRQSSQLAKNPSSGSQGCCSTKPSCTVGQKPHKYTTLPSQHFVTLAQDTLKTTIASECSDLEPMTVALNKVKMVRDTSIFSEEEKPFVDAEGFFQDLEHEKRLRFNTISVCSPLSINVLLRRSNSLSEGETRKRVKTTLRKKEKVVVFPLLYSPEYFEDIIKYSYSHRNNLLLKIEWVDSYLDKRYRTITINWLLQISELIVPHVDPVYFMAVRIFDYTVIKMKLRKGYYKLAAIVSFWMSVKYHNNSILLETPKMYALCNGQYSKEEMLSTERVILKALKFCLNISDPLDFLYYYLKSSNLEENELIKYGSKFVMECATLFENYALVDPPFIAASALYLAQRVLLNTEDTHINFGFERRNVQRYADRVLALNVKYVIMEKYEPLDKYLTPEKFQVAKEFFNI